MVVAEECRHVEAVYELLAGTEVEYFHGACAVVAGDFLAEATVQYAVF